MVPKSFSGPAFHQSLSLYNGLMTAKGSGLTARVIAWPERDVMAVEIDDQRKAPQPVNIDLRMLRYMMEAIKGRNAEFAAGHAVMVTTKERVG